jgi:hypothetical protein
MAKNYFNRYIWLVDVISRRGHVSRREIDDLWFNSALNGTGEKEIPKRTFYNHISAIFDMFGLEIKCDKSLGYYISDWGDSDNSLRRLVSSMSVYNLVNESVGMQDRVLFEDMPSSEMYLIDILEAMRDQKTVNVRYKRFYSDKPDCFEAEPYCIKQFKQRWYMLARNAASDDGPQRYSLDRIVYLEKTGRSYEIPKDFSAKGYFRDFYGMCSENGKHVEDITIKVDKDQVMYFKTLPLHPSQKLVSENGDFAVFSYHVVPTYDFEQELLSKMYSVEVLSPGWFRDEMRDIIKDMLARYGEK